MKTFVLTVSKTFPMTHLRKGEETFFEDKIMKRYSDFNNFLGWQKIHTIRSNYRLWKHRIEEIQSGNAILSIRYWSEIPYRSKQVEICKLDKDSGCGVQELDLSLFKSYDMAFVNSIEPAYASAVPILHRLLAKNDGLSTDDFRAWFKGYDLSQPMAIIHFTKFRY